MTDRDDEIAGVTMGGRNKGGGWFGSKLFEKVVENRDIM